MYVEYSCSDEGICDCVCPNRDCIYHEDNRKDMKSNEQPNSRN